MQKVNSLLKQHLGEALVRTLSLKPGVFVVISKVDTEPDLRYTRVSVGVFPTSEAPYALKTLEHERGALQKHLSQTLTMKRLPRLVFVHDTTEAEADDIEKILRDLS
ncbi:MAG TPA: ribosome-binding factor A [Candidatus Moranbacteria bacterium]|nr:ribosome-binding factor A [Candidatus Moranbacteria bacterium]